MNYWTELSIEYANQRSYLDDLFQVYPTIPEGIRDIDHQRWKEIAFTWLKDKSKYYTDIVSKYQDYNIMSSLVLREFLYQI